MDITNPSIKKAINYTPEVQIKDEESMDKQAFEFIVNEAQISSNSVLKSVITFEDSKKWHLIILQPNMDDKLYMVNEWPKNVILGEDDEGSEQPHIPNLSQKERFLENAALWIVKEELAFKSQVCEFIMNSDLDKSCIVYSN